MNHLLLAVAGGRKTQSIVNACRDAPVKQRILILGYTRASQDELEQRIKVAAPFRRSVEICGWYTFLLRHFVRPYLPALYPGRRLAGFNFDGEPAAGIYATGAPRFLDSEDRAFKLHLSKLALDVMEASEGGVVDRLQHIYDDIYIDEAQDLGGYDLDILSALFESDINVHLVGDMRQALLSTNDRDQRHKKYRFSALIDWFRLQEQKNYLTIEERPQTWRSNQIIADFSDTIFEAAHQYKSTESLAEESHDHEGLFTVPLAQVGAYRDAYAPLCLRHSAASGRQLDLPFVTFGTAKGRTTEHVLIYPTAKVTKFLTSGTALEGRAACSLYIAVTRAKHSVAFIFEGDRPGLSRWDP